MRLSILNVLSHKALDVRSALFGFKNRAAECGGGNLRYVLMLCESTDLLFAKSAEIENVL
jgi:hypothetical protein